MAVIGPKTEAEDENAIGQGYRHWFWPTIYSCAVGASAYYGELKLVVAVGFICIIAQLNENGARLYDLCIRARRTNKLLSKS